MNDECRHGEHHFYHHHHHVGFAEGIAPTYITKLKIVMGMGFAYFLIQLIGSQAAGSLTLLAESGHKLADLGAIGLALLAAWFAHWAASPQKTFGFYRLEILAALVNACALMGIAGFILWSAYQRAMMPTLHPVEGGVMLVVSLTGLMMNTISAFLLFPVRQLSLNVKGALFHVVGDILNSFGEIITAISILWFRFYWMDTVVSVLISLVVLYNASRVFGEAFNILMESAPKHLNIQDIQAYLEGKPGVVDVHDLHVWSIATGKNALLAHVKVQREQFANQTARSLEAALRHEFDLCHITIQLEPEDFVEGQIPF